MRNPPTSKRELLAVAADYCAHRAGHPVAAPHPIAEQWVDDGVRIGDIAAQFCELAAAAGDMRAHNAMRDQRTAQAYGITTPDFQGLIGGTVRLVAARGYQNHTPAIKQICRIVELTDFKPVEVGGAVGIDADFAPVKELQPATVVKANFSSGETVQIATYVARLNVARRLVVNDDFGILVDGVNQIVAALARKEGAVIIEPLTQVTALNGGSLLLADGQPLFHANYSNLIVGSGSITQGTFQAALTALANQKVPGSTTAGELRPRFALVNPSDEMGLRRILADCGMGGMIEVITSVAIQSNQFAVFADPQYGAVFASASLAGLPQPVHGDLQRPRPNSDDLASVVIRGDFGAAPIGRFGAVLCLS